MTRDEARSSFADSGISTDTLTAEALLNLRDRIEARMRDAGAMRDSLRMSGEAEIKATKDGKRWAALLCSSDYFEGREAVSFHPDGFIGFAGWADDTNAQPFFQGFADWTEAMRAAPAGVPAP